MYSDRLTGSSPRHAVSVGQANQELRRARFNLFSLPLDLGVKFGLMIVIIRKGSMDLRQSELAGVLGEDLLGTQSIAELVQY